MTSISNKNVTSESDEIDIGRLIGELIDHRKLIISITALFTLAAILYAVLSTPVYQANALIQVEQKQGNAILNSLSQVLPDAQPQSAPEIALLQSRMILGKTVDDLNLQIQAREKHLPLIGRGLARLSKDKEGEISISSLYLPPDGSD
ncbi:tyrosine-protein kinase, partial [Escherichia coli]